jgi:hypothetical protein
MTNLTELISWRRPSIARRAADVVVDRCLYALETYVERCHRVACWLNA